MHDDYYDDDDEVCMDEPNCPICNDSGKVVADDGYHEYLGYCDIPCRCMAGDKWRGRLGPGNIRNEFPE